MSFVDEARRAFSFLIEMGFQETVCNSNSVRYENKALRTSVVWDPRSGELDVVLYPKVGAQFQGSGYSLSRLLAMEKADAAEAKMPFQVAKEERLGKFLDILADDLKTHGRPALAGDRMFFRRLRYYQDPAEQAFARSVLRGRAPEEAAHAWSAHDYESFIRILEPIEGTLSNVEIAKLNFARKRGSRAASEDESTDE